MKLVASPILVYHAVQREGHRERASDPRRSVRQFGLQMQWLYEHGYHALSLEDLLSSSDSRNGHRHKVVGLTFDDGYEDFLTMAFPILRRYEFAATVFLVAGQLGKRSRWEGAANTPLLSRDQVRALCAQGISFGSHTCTHPHLLSLSKEQTWHELVASKELLEAALDREIPYLAYPYGESSGEIQLLAQRAGYLAACGVITGSPGPFNLWRLGCNSQEDPLSLAVKLSEWYRLSIRLRKWVREDTALGRYLRVLKRRIYSRAA